MFKFVECLVLYLCIFDESFILLDMQIGKRLFIDLNARVDKSTLMQPFTSILGTSLEKSCVLSHMD